MTDTPIAADTDDLQAFEDLYYKRAKTPEPEVEASEPEADPLATEDDLEAEPVLEDEDNDPDPEPETKPKKNTLQTRIDELTRKARENERLALEKDREASEAKRELEEWRRKAEAQEKEKDEPKTPNVRSGPSPDDVDDEGDPKYELGEFDPKYIRDLTKFEMDAYRRELEEKTVAEKIEQAEAQKRQTVANVWNEKVAAVREELPDFIDRAQDLQGALQDIDPRYGDYLANVIMTMDKGAEVFYYLSTNLDEAKRISKLDPVSATVTLGKLEAQFENKRDAPKPKVTQAGEPPAVRVRGSSGKFTVPDDTDDLDAFAQKFFRK